MSELKQASLAAVPVDGSSIGNQSLLERLKGQFPLLSEDVLSRLISDQMRLSEAGAMVEQALA